MINLNDPAAIARARAMIANHRLPLSKTAGAFVAKYGQAMGVTWATRPEWHGQRRAIFTCRYTLN